MRCPALSSDLKPIPSSYGSHVPPPLFSSLLSSSLLLEDIAHPSKHPRRLCTLAHLHLIHFFLSLPPSLLTPPLRLQKQHLLLHHGVVLQHTQRPARARPHQRAEIPRHGHRHQPHGDGARFRFLGHRGDRGGRGRPG